MQSAESSHFVKKSKAWMRKISFRVIGLNKLKRGEDLKEPIDSK
jgi:hypothetical protein